MTFSFKHSESVWSYSFFLNDPSYTKNYFANDLEIDVWLGRRTTWFVFRKIQQMVCILWCKQIHILCLYISNNKRNGRSFIHSYISSFPTGTPEQNCFIVYGKDFKSSALCCFALLVLLTFDSHLRETITLNLFSPHDFNGPRSSCSGTPHYWRLYLFP